MRQGDRPVTKELRKWRWVTIIGAGLLVACLAMLLTPSATNPPLAAGCATFGAVLAGTGVVQMRAARRGTKPHHKAMAWMALLAGVACLLIAVGAINAVDADFSARYPRGLGIVAGFIGTAFFGAAGIYGLVKGPRK
ncbi:hypothetical protein ACFY5D_15095 [Paeniglutamicibacter sp. NPDC012692]|uniref:hypothetical protein n=1 Tax=Paeniglutamicibacter sp. NPDC012692 TaxID=3364388 RepID=UPI0036757D5F